MAKAAEVVALLAAAKTAPAALLVSGEPGIGKTTLWLAACRDASAQGFRVLCARAEPAEVRVAYGVLADLLADIDQDIITALPPVLRGALDRILLRAFDGPAMDERAAAAAFRGVVQVMASQTPVLIAIDDTQWLDTSSAVAVSFAARRLSGPIAVLATARADEPTAFDLTSPLQLGDPEATARLRMSGLSLGGLHAVLSERLDRALPRPLLTQIHEISGGNPLYALELARTVGTRGELDRGLPDTLADLVGARTEGVDPSTGRLLLAAACTPAPTVDLIAEATETPAHRVAELLEGTEAANIVDISGNRIRFTHPLVAAGVYARASTVNRRDAHRRLAGCVGTPELRARHLAAAATVGDTTTLTALDTAAQATRSRGAPAAAAELLDLAIALGGDTAQRRISAAENHFRAGSLDKARHLLDSTIDGLPSGILRCQALMLLGAVRGYGDDTAGAVRALTQAVHEADESAELRLYCLLPLVLATVMVGRVEDAAEQAREAVSLADSIGDTNMLSRALSIWVCVNFVNGRGVDRPALQTALDLEDPQGDATTWYRAGAVQAMVSAWTGDLVAAREQMHAVHTLMAEGGTEIDIIWAMNHLATVDVWLGRYSDAARASREAVERAEQMSGRHNLVTVWGWQAAVAAYTGRADDARAAADRALTTAREIGARFLVDAPLATLVFLEVSLGDYDAAAAQLQLLLDAFDPDRHTEINSGAWLPDAMEALAALNRIDEAESLVSALQTNGERTDRAWMLAMAARGRAHCRAVRGNLPAAEEAAAEAMTHHDRLPMPFERARTQLLLGQLQRRRRRRRQADANLQESLTTFTDLGAPLWAQRARVELVALRGTAKRRPWGLTPVELRIAQRAAAGLTNKEIAAEQFVSVKTVETNLSKVYSKLGIRSRTLLHSALERTGLNGS